MLILISRLGFLAALTLRAGLRLFNALRAFVLHLARNDECINQRFPN